MSVLIVPTDRKSLTYWHSLRHICERVINTLENKPGYPAELQLTPRQGLMSMFENIASMERVLRIPTGARRAS